VDHSHRLHENCITNIISLSFPRLAHGEHHRDTMYLAALMKDLQLATRKELSIEFQRRDQDDPRFCRSQAARTQAATLTSSIARRVPECQGVVASSRDPLSALSHVWPLPKAKNWGTWVVAMCVLFATSSECFKGAGKAHVDTCDMS